MDKSFNYFEIRFERILTYIILLCYPSVPHVLTSKEHHYFVMNRFSLYNKNLKQKYEDRIDTETNYIDRFHSISTQLLLRFKSETDAGKTDKNNQVEYISSSYLSIFLRNT